MGTLGPINYTGASTTTCKCKVVDRVQTLTTKAKPSSASIKEEYSLVERKVIPGKPSHTEYYPTEKGMAVQRILAEIASFSIKYEPEIIFEDRKPRDNTKSLFGTRSLSEVYDSCKAL